MLYDYIVNNYDKDEPIFLSELPGNSRDYVRQEMKQLADEGKVERLYNGVYYLSYMTIFGTKGRVSVDKLVEKKYISYQGKVSGYITGIQLANMYGFTTQNPACIEVCSNEATTKQRKLDIDKVLKAGSPSAFSYMFFIKSGKIIGFKGTVGCRDLGAVGI